MKRNRPAMSFTIDVSRAPSQCELLKKLPKKWCKLGKNKGLYIVHGIYEPKLRVHDVFRYLITINAKGTVSMVPSGGKIGKWGDRDASEPRKRPSIVLIIESPHRHEYDYDEGFKPKGPAQGPTGKKIHELLCEMLQRANVLDLPVGDYDLLIVNPVQFQASLHRLHGKSLNGNSVVQGLRDRSWRAIYKLERQNFLKRMNRYRPYAVLMACTNELQEDLRSEVVQWARSWQKFVPRVPARPLLFEFSAHPQNWKRGGTTLQPVGEAEKQQPAERVEPAKRTPRQRSPRPAPSPNGT